jgi:hypothetical protein
MFNYLPRGIEENPSEALLIARDIEDLDLQITRTEEWMCSQVLFTGKVDIYDWDTNRLLSTLDYGPIINTVVDKPWTDPTSKPLEDLKACVRAVSSASNNMADLIVFGSNAATLFENHTSVQDAYNKLFLKVGELTPEQKAWGLTTLGTWRGLNLLINETTYEGKDGSTQYYVPPDDVLVACSTNQGRMAYAGVAQGDPSTEQLEVYEGTRIPLLWLPDDSDVRKLRLSSRPCPVPPDSSNWTVMIVV